MSSDGIFGGAAMRPGAYNYNGATRAGRGAWAMSIAELARIFALVDRAVLLAPESTQYWLRDDQSLPPVVGVDNGDPQRPAMGWDTYFPLTTPSPRLSSEALFKNGGLEGTSALLSHRLSDDTTIAFSANGNLIRSASAGYSFDSKHADRLFSFVAANPDGTDLFHSVRGGWEPL